MKSCYFFFTLFFINIFLSSRIHASNLIPDAIPVIPTLEMMGIGNNTEVDSRCSKFGVLGTCMNMNDCKGITRKGLCPGSRTFRCCFTTPLPPREQRKCGSRRSYLKNLPADYRTVDGNADFYSKLQNVARYRSYLSQGVQTYEKVLQILRENYLENVHYIIKRLTSRKRNACEAQDYISIKIDKIREGFLQAERNKAKFLILGTPRRPFCYRPRENPAVDRYIATSFVSGSNYRTVSSKVVNILRRVKNRFGYIGFGTYRSHSWGPYSIDVFLGSRNKGGDAAGFYDRAKVDRFFRVLDSVVIADGGCWRGIYDDYAAAKAFNDHKRKGYIRYVPHHGPYPFVLHIHLDIHPSGV